MLQTDRLILRQWTDNDKDLFFKLHSDPEVMEYFPAKFSKQESDAMFAKVNSLTSNRGWGLWACEIKSSGDFIGYIGLHKPELGLPFEPCVEVGWLLAREYWGQGFATEAAKACVEYGFNSLNLAEIVSFTSVKNHRSIAVMKRIGMVDTKQNFFHPKVEVGHLKEHVLYKIFKK